MLKTLQYVNNFNPKHQETLTELLVEAKNKD